MVISLDLLPTFAAAADAHPVEEASGINLLPYLTSQDQTVDAQRELLWRRDHMTDLALRSGKYKWIENRVRKENALYNLEVDVGEETNIAGAHPEVVEQIRSRYYQWEESVPPPAFKSGWTPADEAAKQRRIKALKEQNP
jgi:arylsulfatase A-like enzyme